VWAQLFGLACETVPLDDEMRVSVRPMTGERLVSALCSRWLTT
jgi:hypothetical protein